MNLLKTIFGKKEEPIKSNQDFWNWFQQNANGFYDVVKRRSNIEESFFAKLSPKLNELKEGFFFLVGMYDDATVELIITADGNIKNIVFVEELIDSAPKIEGWKFTALKPALDIGDVNIKMDGYSFNNNNLSFYSTEHREFPDEIDVTIVHEDFNDSNKAIVTNGTYIFLDNYIGELNFVTSIDNLSIIGKNAVQGELVPIEKLKDFLVWRQKEFIEKYEGTRHDTENDTYSGMEATLQNGNPVLAIINANLMKWEAKASHPWIVNVGIKYDGRKNKGLPANQATLDLLNDIENKILTELKDFEGYLDVGRETAESKRNIFYACKDFRKPSKVLYQIQSEYKGVIEIEYDIYKDKYWQSFDRFVNN